jgi:hypothetical protein
MIAPLHDPHALDRYSAEATWRDQPSATGKTIQTGMQTADARSLGGRKSALKISGAVIDALFGELGIDRNARHFRECENTKRRSSVEEKRCAF